MPKHVNPEEYNTLRDTILEANNCIRCVECGKLLAKKDNGMISVKKRGVDLVVLATEMKIVCYICQTVNEIN